MTGHARVVLAVSGGLDSMVLLDAAAAAAVRATQLSVAHFDHATGSAARAAARFVQRQASALRIGVVTSRAPAPLHSEAALREARWCFLRDVARDGDGTVFTGHTADDQIETVLMR